MRYSKKEIEAMKEEDLKRLIKRQEEMKLSEAAQTIIKKTMASDVELETLKNLPKE